MEIKETTLFTKLIQDLMSDEDYRLFQNALILNPASGDIIKGGGGIRKIRWRLADKGKRGGVRFIYYWINEMEQIYMLLVYPKASQENMTQKQLTALKRLVEEELNG